MTKCSWFFTPHRPGPDIDNPLGGEHFNQGAIGDAQWEAGESLVREAIQNSLDAAGTSTEPVSVNISVSQVNALSQSAAQFWFGSLWPHIHAKECKLRGIPHKPESCSFITIEDFGTKGLEGDTTQWRMPKDDESNDFFSFFRAQGLSGKSEKHGGSWGAGKSVFSRCSRINTFLAVSVRRSDSRAIAIGKSVLWHHYLGNDEFRATGQFGERDFNEPDLILPTSDSAMLKKLQDDFHLRRQLLPTRGEEPQPGLSIVIPFPDPDVTARSLLSTVVREYFQPILAGKLRVVVSGAGVRGFGVGSVVLDEDSILEETAKLKRPELVRLLELASWSHTEGPRCLWIAPAPPEEQRLTWSESYFDSTCPEFKAVSERYNKGQAVAIRIPVWVHPAGASAQRSHFDVFMKRDDEGDGCKPLFIRAGIVVPNARERAVRGHSLLSIVNIEDSPLAKMLRAAEPPAHTTWSHTTQNFRGRYENGRQTIDFVTDAPKRLVDLLSTIESEEDLFALAEFFPEADETGKDAKVGRGRRKGRETPPPPPPPPRRPLPFVISDIDGGVRVSRDNSVGTPLPPFLSVRLAYDNGSPSPLGAYFSADFQLPKLKRTLYAAELISITENSATIRPLGDDFSFDITGFDSNRDLYVKVNVLESVNFQEGE